jgi:predicted site-specific integrase-resolvase
MRKKSPAPQEEVTMDDMLNLSDASKAIGKSVRTLRRYIETGRLKAFVCGARGLLVRESDVMGLLKAYVPKAPKRIVA